MKAPDALRSRLEQIPGMETGHSRLVVVLSQLGDFDSLEYAQALVPALPRMAAAGINLQAIGIGDEAGADRFCQYTALPRQRLQVDGEPTLHRALDLYGGLSTPAGPWPALLLMCAGIGSPGTLMEVLRGYTGDRSAPQLLADDETIQAGPLPPLRGSFFARAGGSGFQVRAWL
jgi:hypothetical protein